jgi:hypothetical protein
MNIGNLSWFKSSYSSSGDGDCVEVALSWRKSSYSGEFEDACVEVATRAEAVHVRDSKNQQGPCLTLSPAAWTSFVSRLAGR